MPIQADRIYVGANYPIEYESLEPTQEDANSFQFTRVPLNPLSATVILYDVQNNVNIQLGSGVDPANASISGNVIRYTIPANKLSAAGDYKVFTTATYYDGRITTDVRKLKVLDKT